MFHECFVRKGYTGTTFDWQEAPEATASQPTTDATTKPDAPSASLGKKITFVVQENATKVQDTILGWAREHHLIGTVQRTGELQYTAYMYGNDAEVANMMSSIKATYGLLEIEIHLTQ